MDFIKNAVGGGGQQSNTNDPTNQPASSSNQQEDYGDKGLDFIENKTGHTLSRDQNEKITDAARGMYEKATGNKVDPKYSN